MQVWDAASGQRLAVMKGHTDCVTSVAWSPDGQRLATASYDKTAAVRGLGAGPLTRVRVYSYVLTVVVK